MLDVKYTSPTVQTGTIWPQQSSPALCVMLMWCFGAFWGPMRWWESWVFSTRDTFTHFFWTLLFVTLLFVISWSTEGAPLSCPGRLWFLMKDFTHRFERTLHSILFIYQNFGLCDVDIAESMMQISPLKILHFNCVLQALWFKPLLEKKKKKNVIVFLKMVQDGSVTVSQLQGPWFDPDLGWLSVWSLTCFLCLSVSSGFSAFNHLSE